MHPLLKEKIVGKKIVDIRNNIPPFVYKEEALLWLQNDSFFDLSRPETVAERQKLIDFYTNE